MLAGEGRIGDVPPSTGWAGGFVATSDPRPAEAAARVLALGGNAVDAAAVALFMLNVVEPQSSGIGGGGFMMIHLAAEGRTLVVDARERAPAAADPQMFLADDGQPMPFGIASTSGVAVGVPGALRGVELALSRWGTMTLADALGPAIAAAEEGIIVDERFADSTRSQRLETECGTGAWDVARRVFRTNGGASSCGGTPAVGEILVQRDLARTLRLIAAQGADVFYNCDDPSGLARAVVATQRAARSELGDRGAGRMTCADLAGYRAVIREPVEATYRGWIIRAAPPPSSGGLTLIQMLKMLERFSLADRKAGFGEGSAPTLNVVQESMRLAFADRAMWMGDTDILPNLPTRGLIDDRYLSRRSASCPDGDPASDAFCITPGLRMTGIRAGDPRPYETAEANLSKLMNAAPVDRQEGTETTHFTITDRWGNIVSCTTTVEATWGSGLMVPGFGFLLNNELTDFNFVPRQRGLPMRPIGIPAPTMLHRKSGHVRAWRHSSFLRLMPAANSQSRPMARRADPGSSIPSSRSPLT
ncbi:MAG: gamma-glutamyltransferase [Rhodospirillales bacterium]|nr:gamma-glutamyltransferase [Rhodospirillales bacterium]